MPTKQDLKEVFSKNVANITFKKVDGSKRTMVCTLKEEFLPKAEQTEGKQKKQTNENILPVWDLEQKAFRSFRIDSLIDYKILENYMLVV